MKTTRLAAKTFIISSLASYLELKSGEILESDDLRDKLGLSYSALIELRAVINERHWRGVQFTRAEILSCKTVGNVVDIAYKKANPHIVATPGGRTHERTRERNRLWPKWKSLAKRIRKSAPKKTSHRRIKKPRDQCEYVVWYGTNRRRKETANGVVKYTAARDPRTHYGTCNVYIPKSHKIGSIGSPWWKRLMNFTDDRLKILSVTELESNVFWKRIFDVSSKKGPYERHAVIFVHGYNVSFRDAAVRAVQIGFDLSIRGAMAFFSWPSKARFLGYAADAASIEASERQIADFMTDFASKSGADHVHIIAHSMGNRGVLRAVNRIAAAAQRRTGVPFDQIVLAAADIDTDTFTNLAAAYSQVARRTTLYVSRSDLAVEMSRWLHEFTRVGLTPPICIVPDIDTINVTNVDLTRLGHGYVGEARDVLKDMHDLFLHGTAPEHRFGLRSMVSDQGKRYWSIGA